MEPVGPTITGSATAMIDCRLVPCVALLFWDVVGPFISITPRVVATVDGSFDSSSNAGPSGKWNVKGSIRADAGLTGEITIPGVPRLSNMVNDGIARSQFNLFNVEKQWDGSL
jgi:hypothetical protein